MCRHTRATTVVNQPLGMSTLRVSARLTRSQASWEGFLADRLPDGCGARIRRASTV
jgi:hypothetical protein